MPKIRGKRWEKGMEEPIRKKWRQDSHFRFDRKSRKPIYSIDTPPPYVNAPIHIGHAATYTIMDFIARFKRMTGHQVIFPLGLDRNGLPIEMAAEKRFGVSIQETPRKEYVEACRKILEESSMASVDSFYRLGISFCSWEHGREVGDVYHTDSDRYRALTQATFIDLWNKGLIHKDKRVSNYCPDCKTTIADAEIEYRDLPSEFLDVKWKIKETGESVIISTTRPELLCSCSMVVYNPKDKRYKKLSGKHAILPLYGREVPIRPHPVAKMEKGSGLMMMCSFGDYTDILFYRDMKLKPIISIGKDGRMNEKAGFLKGLTVEQARKEMKDRLEKEGLIKARKRMIHRTPICERSKSPIEFIEMTEYYLDQLDWRTNLKRDVIEKTSFFAPKSKQILIDWINGLTMDWAVSRRRFYATEIPLWYCECGETIVPPKGRYYRPWLEGPPVKKCPRCGRKNFRGEERVFDTWFDSSISPFYVLHYEYDKPFFRKAHPCSLRPQGREIVRTWLYYTLLRTYQLTGKPVFEDVWIHYHILDGKGTKMSKSLGNIIDPRDVIGEFGAEPFRLWCALEGNLTLSDLRCSFDRIEGGAKFLTKLWNVARFISSFRKRKGRIDLQPLDRWIRKEAYSLLEYSRKEYEKYEFHKPVTRIRYFIWEMLASHYLELVKNRAYNHEGKFTKAEQQAAIHTLHEVLDLCLLILSPVACFITHRLYREMHSRDIEDLPWPETDKKARKGRIGFRSEELMELNSRIWKAKKDRGLSLKSEIEYAMLPEKFRPIERDLKETHKIRRIEYGRETSLVFP